MRRLRDDGSLGRWQAGQGVGSAITVAYPKGQQPGVILSLMISTQLDPAPKDSRRADFPE
jgi:hypothetical protein